MVRSKFYLICGNCGCDNEWKWEYIEEETENIDGGEVVTEENVHLYCGNCATIHSIEQKANKLIKKL